MTETRGGRGPLIGAGLLLIVHAIAYVLWTEDDVGVTLRYAVNLVEGRGLVYNPGERIEAISNLGYTLLLAPAYALLPGVDPRTHLLVVAKLLGLLAAVVALIPVRRLASQAGLGSDGSTTTLLLVAGSTPVAAWAVGGLEVPFVALATWSLLADAARLIEADADLDWRPIASRAGATAAALVLLRVDGFVAPIIVALAAVTVVGPRALAKCVPRVALPPAAMFAAIIGFRLAYYGQPWPHPVMAKVDVASSVVHFGATLTHLVRFSWLLGTMPIVLLALALPWRGGWATTPERRVRRLLAAAVAGLAGYTVVVGADWMPLYRFLVPVVPLVIILIVAAVASVGKRVGRCERRGFAVPVVALLVALSLLAGHASFRTRRATPLWYLHPTFDASSLVEFWSPAVHWLQTNVEPDAILLTSEAGFIPYLTALKTLDSYGLATPAISALPRGAVRRSTLGVHAEFVAGPPINPAQAYLATAPAGIVVLQERMVQGWNAGTTPVALFVDRYRLAHDSPVGRWAIYVADGGPGPPVEVPKFRE